jgi:hypothetical protein
MGTGISMMVRCVSASIGCNESGMAKAGAARYNSLWSATVALQSVFICKDWL